jgi:hypothetical protein
MTGAREAARSLVVCPTDPLEGLPLLRAVALRGGEILRVREEPVVWVWTDIAGASHHVEISGPSYSGKTTLALILVVALANPTGRPVSVLGHDVVPVAPGRLVVLVEEENSRKSSADVLAAVCAMLGLPAEETLDRILLVARAGVTAHVVTSGPPRDLWAELHALGQAGRVGALFLDSRARVFGGEGAKANDEDDQARTEATLHQFIQAAAAPAFVVSHTRKGQSRSGPLGLEDVSGSHQRAAGADVVLLVSADRSAGRIQRSQVLFAKLRDSTDEHPEPATFAISKTGGTWALEGGVRLQERPAHERVAEHLADGRQHSARSIREALGLSGDAAKRALEVLRVEGRVASSTRIVKGRKRTTYRAKDGQP